MRHDFLRELNFIDDLPSDLKLLIETVGLEKFIELYDLFEKQAIYFSTTVLTEFKKKYIHKNFNMDAKTLAAKLNMSSRFVYRVRKESKDELNNFLK